MKLAYEIARHIREFHFGGNWTDVALKPLLKDVSWVEATTKIEDLNSIAELVFHMNYYINALIKVLQKGPLLARDKYSFDLPPIRSNQDWKLLKTKTWSEAEEFAALIEKLSDQDLDEIMFDQKYGTYFRNFQGIIEHLHYHLGQIALLKKMIKKD